jgi:hypothetical protein
MIDYRFNIHSLKKNCGVDELSKKLSLSDADVDSGRRDEKSITPPWQCSRMVTRIVAGAVGLSCHETSPSGFPPDSDALRIKFRMRPSGLEGIDRDI